MRTLVVVSAIIILAGICVTSSVAQTNLEGTAELPSVTAAENASATAPGANTQTDFEQATAFDELIHKLRQGGVVVILQILLSVAGLTVVLERLVNLRGKALVPPALIARADQLWKQQQYDELIESARKDGSLLGRVIEEVVRHRSAGYQVVSQLAGDVAAREIRRHTQYLFPIALVATLEPLLGLLGTMLGMIGAFETVAVAGSMGDASILADDIAKALVTTAVGLIIAIPAVFVYHCLKSQVGFGSASLDQAASGLISDWFLLTQSEIPPETAVGSPADPSSSHAQDGETG